MNPLLGYIVFKSLCHGNKKTSNDHYTYLRLGIHRTQPLNYYSNIAQNFPRENHRD